MLLSEVGRLTASCVWTMAVHSSLLQDTPNPIPTYGQRPNMSGTLERNGSAKDWVSGDASVGYFANPGILTQPDDYTLGNAPPGPSPAYGPPEQETSPCRCSSNSLSRVSEKGCDLNIGWKPLTPLITRNSMHPIQQWDLHVRQDFQYRQPCARGADGFEILLVDLAERARTASQ